MRAIRPTNAGSCRILKKCSTTMPKSSSSWGFAIMNLAARCSAHGQRKRLRWLQREMTNVEGAFCASLDADSEGVEGKFYVWTYAEIEALLGQEDAAFFGKFYDASPSGNWEDEAHGGSVIILNRLEAKPPALAEEARLAPLRQRLFDAREKRVRPGLDDKILADWNGLMIAALVNAATLFDAPEWIGLAARAYDFIVRAMQFTDAEGNKRLAHGWRAGVLVTPGLALDHAAMIRAALALHETRNWAPALVSARDYLADAIAWAEALETYHVDPESGLLNMAAKDAGDVILRLAPTGTMRSRTRIRFICPPSFGLAGSPARRAGSRGRTNFLRRSGQRRGAILLAMRGF